MKKKNEEEQENSHHTLSISDGSSDGIQRPDGNKKKHFQESFISRRDRIEQLIQTIRNCLADEQFRKITTSHGNRPLAVEGSSRPYESEIGELYQQFIREVGTRRESIESEKGEFEHSVSDFESELAECNELDNRERSIRATLESETSRINLEIEAVERQIGEREQDAQRRLETEAIHINNQIEDIERQTSDIDQQIADAERQIRDTDASIARAEREKTEIESELGRLQYQIEQSGSAAEEKDEEIGRLLRDKYQQIEREIASQHQQMERNRSRFIEAVKNRNSEGIEFTDSLKIALDDLRQLDDFQSAFDLKARYEKALGYIKSKTYKNWND